ncbi:MAG: Uma2 family endonuclease [Elainellaceae cyanobacterium]
MSDHTRQGWGESVNQTVDYRAKRVEYNVLNIPEYWIVDPIANRITILSLVEDLYEAAVFEADMRLESGIFPDLEAIATQILAAE